MTSWLQRSGITLALPGFASILPAAEPSERRGIPSRFSLAVLFFVVACLSGLMPGGLLIPSPALGSAVHAEPTSGECWISSGKRQFSSGFVPTDVFVGDFNGDGRSDLGGYDGNGNWELWPSTNTGLDGNPIDFTWLPRGPNRFLIFPGKPMKATFVFAGDFDADGITDVGVFDGIKTWRFFYPSDATWKTGKYQIRTWSFPEAKYVIPIDFTGEAQCDLGAFDGKRWLFRVSNGRAKGFGRTGGEWEQPLDPTIPPGGAQREWAPGPTSKPTGTFSIFTGRFDGDEHGRVNTSKEFGIWDGGKQFLFQVSTIGGWRPDDGTRNFNNWDVATPGVEYAFAGDFDGDGHSDVGVGTSLIRIRRGNGCGFMRSEDCWDLSWIKSTRPPMIGDFDGNGTSDIAVFEDQTWNVVFSSPPPTPPKDENAIILWSDGGCSGQQAPFKGDSPNVGNNVASSIQLLRTNQVVTFFSEPGYRGARLIIEYPSLNGGRIDHLDKLPFPGDPGEQGWNDRIKSLKFGPVDPQDGDTIWPKDWEIKFGYSGRF